MTSTLRLPAVVAAIPIVGWAVLAMPGLDRQLVVPVEHFWIVAVVSLVTALVAGWLALGAVRIRNYRAVLLALGFATMGAVFMVHGLATPGVILPLSSVYNGAGIVGVSAFLSMVSAAVPIAAAYTPFAALERRVNLWSMRALVGGAFALFAIYAVAAMSQLELIEDAPIGLRPYSGFLAVATIGLLGYAAWRQLGFWRIGRLPVQAALVGALVLLAEAQAMMATTTVYSLTWWLYHLAMLLAVCLAFRALIVERLAGESLRATVEGALALQFEVGDLENIEVIAVLSSAIERYDRELRGHNLRVAELSITLGRELGIASEGLRVLARAGLLHDVGKLHVPESILRKEGPLDPDEWAVMKRHPEFGVRIMERAGGLRREQEIVFAHHERLDGSGYPLGLRGTAIPLEARIIAVVDTFDVLLSDRPYRSARPLAEALRVIEEERGTRLDPAVCEALFRTIAEGAGSMPWAAAPEVSA